MRSFRTIECSRRLVSAEREVVSDTEASVGTCQRLAAQEELSRQVVQVSVNRREDVVTPF